MGISPGRSEQVNSTEDYTRSRVPDEATISGFRIAIVVFGIGITLPIFFIGSQLVEALGFAKAAVAMCIGCFLVATMMVVTSIIGARTRLSTYMILRIPFGKSGAKIVNLLLAVTYIGYFGATGDIFGKAIHDALISFYGLDLPTPVCSLVGCIAMASTALFGFKIIERFSELAVPVLGVFMLYVVYLALQQPSAAQVLEAQGLGGMSVGVAISTVIGANILMAVSGPDLTRYARNGVEGAKSVTGLAIGYPLIMLVSGIPTLVIGETDIMQIMIGLGVAVSALFILVFSTWTTNTVNLYSAELTLATVFTRVTDRWLGISAGVLGTAAAVFGIMDFFLPFVLFLGVATTPVAGVYIADYFFVGGTDRYTDMNARLPFFRPQAFAAWFIGSALAGLTTYEVVSLTTIPAVDALVSSFLVYLAAAWVSRRFVA